jgi:hypothetical protein
MAPLAALALVMCKRDVSVVDHQTLPVDDLPELTIEEVIRVGSTDDPDIGFSMIGEVHIDQRGDVYVFDRQESNIRRYSADGTILSRIGGRGSGPGEFTDGAVTFGVFGDSIWALQLFHQRLAYFGRDGRLLSDSRVEEATLPWHQDGLAVALVPGASVREGFISMVPIPRGVDRGTVAGKRDTIMVPRVLFDRTGAIIDTVGFYPSINRQSSIEDVEVNGAQYPVPNPPPREGEISLLTVHGRVAITWGTAVDERQGIFRVTWLDLRDDTLRALSYRYRPVRFTDALLDAIAADATRSGMTIVGGFAVHEMRPDPIDAAAAQAAIRARLRYPEFQPAVNATRLGNDGSIWLRREDDGADTFRWLVLDGNGRPVGNLDLPRRGFRIAWVYASTIWAAVLDDMDVPWLVRYRIIYPRSAR